MPRQITVRQHFAPESYFKRFANDQNRLQTLETRLNRIGRARPYAGVCYAPFYYAVETGTPDDISQEIEDYFSVIETSYGQIHDSLVDNLIRSRQIPVEQMNRLAWFVACLWIRSPTMREQLNSMHIRGLKDIFQSFAHMPDFADSVVTGLAEKGINITLEQAEDTASTFRSGDYDLSTDNVTHLKFITETETWRNWLYAKNWRFYIANGEKSFITSDTPVIELFNGDTFMEQLYGNHIMQRRQFFALSPKIIVELTDPLKSNKWVKRSFINDASVVQYNLLRARHSKEFCYSRSREELEDLAPYYEGGIDIRKYVSEYLRDTQSHNSL